MIELFQTVYVVDLALFHRRQVAYEGRFELKFFLVGLVNTVEFPSLPHGQ